MDSGFKVWLPTLNVIEPEKVSVADLAKEPMIMLETENLGLVGV